MACTPPTIPVSLTLCNNSGAAANVTDAMIGINTATKTFLPTSIIPFSGGTTGSCRNFPTGYTSVIGVIVQRIGQYTLPAIGSTPYGSNRDSNGLLTPTAVGTVLENLNICININTSTFNFNKDDISSCNSKDDLFIRGVQIECGYYYALYKYAIRNLAAAIVCPVETPVKSFGTNWPDSSVALRKYTDAAIILNLMVNDVIYIIDQVAQKRTNVDIATLTAKLGVQDENLKGTSGRLTTQRTALTSPGQDKMVLFKEMETYSRQKAAYHNNMLALYSFLNITALGLLFYVYRST
jgi:hypothetical protein